MLTDTDLQAIWLTIRLAGMTTLILLLIGTPVAWWLARSRAWWKGPVGAVVALPLVLPLARPGFITAAILGFAHTVGEFGVVLMIGGNIPGVTRVASVQIYDHVEALEYADAHRLAGVMLAFSFLVLLALYGWRQSPKKGA